MSLPKRRKREKMGLREPEQLRSPRHLQFVRGFYCLIQGLKGHVCRGRIVAAHSRAHNGGGMGYKPGDNQTVPFCEGAHEEQHQKGQKRFESDYGIDMSASGAWFWQISPERKRLERAERKQEAGR